jgi:hypothetical protein
MMTKSCQERADELAMTKLVQELELVQYTVWRRRDINLLESHELVLAAMPSLCCLGRGCELAPFGGRSILSNVVERFGFGVDVEVPVQLFGLIYSREGACICQMSSFHVATRVLPSPILLMSLYFWEIPSKFSSSFFISSMTDSSGSSSLSLPSDTYSSSTSSSTVCILS